MCYSDNIFNLIFVVYHFFDFLGSSPGKESISNTGDPGSISESRRSPEEGIGYLCQFSGLPWWLRPAMLETSDLRWEDSLRNAWEPTPVFLPGQSSWTEEPGGLQFMRLLRVFMTKHSSISLISLIDWTIFKYYDCCRLNCVVSSPEIFQGVETFKGVEVLIPRIHECDRIWK